MLTPEVVTERVDEPEPLTLAGLKLATAPLGRLPALKFTVPVNPPEADIEKSPESVPVIGTGLEPKFELVHRGEPQDAQTLS